MCKVNCIFVLFLLAGVFDELSKDECANSENFCPSPCKCNDGIVDCREKMLTKVPSRLPEDTTEL